ncbi:hypothetical protein CP969_16585 [Streptomyces viridosporus T7A]|uniref:Uncharacterized protein n=1 Tax=Streptomyces viridosporus T7A TaxID=665577 RepID=A0ABX6AF57_STRVD|nr:hypothetical protein CP969_16585 [Streptomyces viridosporus T7A]
MHHRCVRLPPCSQPLLRFRGRLPAERREAVSYLGMTADPEGRRDENGWSVLVQTVKFRQSACAADRHAQGCRYVLTARSRC